MPMKDKALTWVDPWLEHNFDLLSADLQQKILSERERWRVDAAAAQRTREALLNRLVASVDVITSTTMPELKFYTLDKAIDITARAITEALHDIPASKAHTSEYWADTLSKHQERLRALVELGRLSVFDTNTSGACVFESGLPDWAKCGNLGLSRSGIVDFARCQGVEIRGAQEPERKSTKNYNTMLKVMATLIYLRNEPKSDGAISTEIESRSQLMGIAVSARTVTNYIADIGKTLEISRKKLGLSDREDASD